MNNAFLHGELQEIVYMTISEGVSCSSYKVYKLKKSLYGLKQASRKWYEKLTTLLLAKGYCQSTVDYSLFTLQHGSDFTALLVYVGDIILAGTSLVEFQRIKNILDNQFKIKDLGILKYFLGLEVAHSKEGISISQRKYCLDLLDSSGLLGAKSAPTPLDTSVKLHQDTSKPFTDVSCVGTKSVSQNHRLSFDDNKVLKSQLDMLNICSSVQDHNQSLIHGGSI